MSPPMTTRSIARGEWFVIRKGTSCNNLRMALLARQGLYVLDTKVGPVRLKGRSGQSPRVADRGAGPLAWG